MYDADARKPPAAPGTPPAALTPDQAAAVRAIVLEILREWTSAAIVPVIDARINAASVPLAEAIAKGQESRLVDVLTRAFANLNKLPDEADWWKAPDLAD